MAHQTNTGNRYIYEYPQNIWSPKRQRNRREKERLKTRNSQCMLAVADKASVRWCRLCTCDCIAVPRSSSSQRTFHGAIREDAQPGDEVTLDDGQLRAFDTASSQGNVHLVANFLGWNECRLLRTMIPDVCQSCLLRGFAVQKRLNGSTSCSGPKEHCIRWRSEGRGGFDAAFAKLLWPLVFLLLLCRF